MNKMKGRNTTMMLSDPLKVPDYSTPGKKKRFVEAQCRKTQEAVINATGDDDRGFLQSPYGERRQKAILSSLDRAEEEFKGFGLRSVVESFTQNELSPFNNYNHIDSDMDLRIGAALWILDKLRASGKMHEANKILPDTAGNPDVWYLPTDFHHVCYDNDLIQSVMYVMTNRYPGEQGNGAGCSVITEQNARGREPSELWRELLNLLPEDEVAAATETFKTKLWELATRNMKGQAYYDKEVASVFRQIQNATGPASGPLASPMMGRQGPLAQKTDALQQTGILPDFGGIPGLGGGFGGYLGGDPGGGLGSIGTGMNDVHTLAMRGEELVEQDHEYTRNFDRFLHMDKKQIRKETGSREVAEALAGFTVDDPYALCFALFYLIDTGDAAPWLMRSGCSLMVCVQALLPWNIQEEDWDDDDWDTWFDGMQYNQNGWLERGVVPDQLDYLHERHNGKTLAQIIYRLSRSVVPVGLHPFEKERERLIAEGMEENKARKITDMAELMFLQAFQAKQYRQGEFSFDWEDHMSGEDHAFEEDHLSDDAEDVAAAIGPMPTPAIPATGYWGRVAAEQGIDVRSADSKAGAGDGENSDTEAELQRLKGALEQARKQVKSLQGMLTTEKRTADADRAKYEHELKSLRMEHRELADLRELVFNRESENPERLEKVEKQYEYPYQTRKRTVVFGGHDSFLRAFKPMLPNVKFVDPGNLTFSADIIRNADVVWIQNNCISHSQFWNIVKNCKLAGVQMRYFGFASAEKCAEQLVTEDLK